MSKQPPRKQKTLQPSSVKNPLRLQNPTTYYDKRFSWRVLDKYIDCGDCKLGWSGIDATHLLTFIIKGLQSYETMTWGEIRQNKKSCHPWELDEIPTEFYNRLQERQIDIDELFQISLGSLPRVFGNRIGPTFYLIWYDSNHKFWPTTPKNT